MVCDVQTAERNADRLAAMRETDGAKPFDLTADQFAAVSAYYAACRAAHAQRGRRPRRRHLLQRLGL